MDAWQAFKKFKARCKLNFSGPRKDKSEKGKLSSYLVERQWNRINFRVGFNRSRGDETRYRLTAPWELPVSKEQLRWSRYKLRTLKQEPGWNSGFDHFWRQFEYRSKNAILPAQMSISSMPLSLDLFPSVFKPKTKFLDKDATLTLNTALDITRSEGQVTKSKKFHPVLQLMLTRWNMIFPSNPTQPTPIRLFGCCATERDIYSWAMLALLMI